MAFQQYLRARDFRRGSESVARFRGLTVEVRGIAVYAVASAEPLPATAPIVVLVHGLGLSHRYMMPVARALAAEGCRVYGPDLPGFGSSGHPPHVLDVPGLADALAAWMEGTGLEGVALLGNSFGCQIIADMVARHPKRVERAVLQGPTTPSGKRTWLQQFVYWRQNAPYNPPEMDTVAYDDYQRCGYWRLWQTFRASLRDRIEDKLPHISVPVLVVRGASDPICHADWASEIAHRLPLGQLAEIPAVAHTLCYTAPVELASVAKTFIDEACALPRESLETFGRPR